MLVNKNIYLVGFMGAGKSHSGRELAAALDWPFVDLDAVIEAAAERTISAIFAEDGEATFRELEAAALRATANRAPAVIATGGGAPCFHDGMQWLLANGLVIFLDPPVEVLVERLEAGRAHRPLLQEGKELRRMITTRLNARRPVYDQAPIRITSDAGIAALITFLTTAG